MRLWDFVRCASDSARTAGLALIAGLRDAVFAAPKAFDGDGIYGPLLTQREFEVVLLKDCGINLS
jgi:hypothetical protein